MPAAAPELPFRTDRTADSPEIPSGAGLAIRSGVPFVDGAGVGRVLIHGAYNLPGPNPLQRIAVIALLDGTAQLAVASMSFDGPPPRSAAGPAGRTPPADMLKGGYFNCEMRTDFRIRPAGGVFHVSAHSGALRSEVVTVEVPPLPPERSG
jgi:hypothetical protein